MPRTADRYKYYRNIQTFAGVCLSGEDAITKSVKCVRKALIEAGLTTTTQEMLESTRTAEEAVACTFCSSLAATERPKPFLITA